MIWTLFLWLLCWFSPVDLFRDERKNQEESAFLKREGSITALLMARANTANGYTLNHCELLFHFSILWRSMCSDKDTESFLGTGNEPVSGCFIQCRASESFFLPVALIGFYSCGVPADQVVLWVGANTELEKYRALMGTNGWLFILFVNLIAP